MHASFPHACIPHWTELGFVAEFSSCRDKAPLTPGRPAGSMRSLSRGLSSGI